MKSRKCIHFIAGARPNFMKIAPIYKRLKRNSFLIPVFIHTGQHYDYCMSEAFLTQLGLPAPDDNLEVGSGPHGRQTAETMMRYEEAVLKDKPDLVLVVGDVNSTLACALVASKLHIPVAHVEAGLRSFDRRMPEEVNRVLTDQISDFLFTTADQDKENLIREGISENKIHMVGNIMIESLIASGPMIRESRILSKYKLNETKYVLLTLHRPSNVDDPTVFSRILNAIKKIAEKTDVLFPAHPRTRKRISEFGLVDASFSSRIHIIDPVAYYDFLSLQSHATVVLTDSGGVQTETTYLRVPCLTLRENTEWTLTLHEGTNKLVGTDPERIIKETEHISESFIKPVKLPKYWDNQVSERILDVLKHFF